MEKRKKSLLFYIESDFTINLLTIPTRDSLYSFVCSSFKYSAYIWKCGFHKNFNLFCVCMFNLVHFHNFIVKKPSIHNTSCTSAWKCIYMHIEYRIDIVFCIFIVRMQLFTHENLTICTMTERECTQLNV